MYVLPETSRKKMNIKERMLKEVAMGYIHGMGFTFRAKPHAFASSNCANKMVQ